MREHFRENYRLLGLKIAYYRKKRGYTQEQFAELIGKSWSFISQIEANNGAVVKGVSLDTLFTISEVLDVPMEKFFAED
ncbi:MAG: helix-turn-helix transcriptional regulator [Oscillospiraceae bacterium]|nr:helix-turn-helix transcriptional regulator [Oscillospiraceae bacterium]